MVSVLDSWTVVWFCVWREAGTSVFFYNWTCSQIGCFFFKYDLFNSTRANRLMRNYLVNKPVPVPVKVLLNFTRAHHLMRNYLINKPVPVPVKVLFNSTSAHCLMRNYLVNKPVPVPVKVLLSPHARIA